jgi:predicted transcriptional regulator
MWRKMIALGLFSMVGTASAEQTLDEALQNMAVFDCVVDGQSALYVFRNDANGEASLIDDSNIPVRRDGDKYSMITSDGALEISAQSYFIYKDGEAISGSCYDATSTAQAIFPTLMDGFLLSSPEGIAEAEAAAILVRDMQVKTEIEIARVTAESELAQAALAGELEATQDALAKTQTELDVANEHIPALFESADALSKELESVNQDLASQTKSFDKTLLDLAIERSTSADLRAQIADLEGELAETKVAFAQESAVSTLKDAALERAMARLEEMTAELEKVTQERRSLAANVASLNQKTSDLAGKLGKTQTELTSAIEAEAKAMAFASDVGTLTDEAINRIATLQGRGVSDVRRELCSMIPTGGRPARCGSN